MTAELSVHMHLKVDRQANSMNAAQGRTFLLRQENRRYTMSVWIIHICLLVPRLDPIHQGAEHCHIATARGEVQCTPADKTHAHCMMASLGLEMTWLEYDRQVRPLKLVKDYITACNAFLHAKSALTV